MKRYKALKEKNKKYYHGSTQKFDKPPEGKTNDAISEFGKLKVKGIFITDDKKQAEFYATPKGYVYNIELLNAKIFDMINKKHYKLFEKYLENNKEYPPIDYFIEEGYIIDNIPTWDNYPIIYCAKNNNFDGIRLQEYLDGKVLESIFVFNTKKLKWDL